MSSNPTRDAQHSFEIIRAIAAYRTTKTNAIECSRIQAASRIKSKAAALLEIFKVARPGPVYMKQVFPMHRETLIDAAEQVPDHPCRGDIIALCNKR